MMELYPLVLPDLPETVQRGDARRISHGPLSVEQVLGRGLQQMLDEDQAERQAADPVAWARAHRPRRLIDRLLGR